MSTVKHHLFSVNIEMEGVDAYRFPEAMDVTVHHLLEQAAEIGHTVDWSTLTIEPSQIIETRTMAGDVDYIYGPLMLSVDTVSIQ